MDCRGDGHHDFRNRLGAAGFERMLMHFLEAPDLADQMLEIPYRYVLTAAKRMARLGPEEDRAELLNWVATVGYNGGLIVSLTHHVQLDKPLEHL